MFDCYCKKVLKYKAYDYYRKMERRKAREVSFDELSEQNLAKLSRTDEELRRELETGLITKILQFDLGRAA
jgi:hypothetical protein